MALTPASVMPLVSAALVNPIENSLYSFGACNTTDIILSSIQTLQHCKTKVKIKPNQDYIYTNCCLEVRQSNVLWGLTKLLCTVQQHACNYANTFAIFIHGSWIHLNVTNTHSALWPQCRNIITSIIISQISMITGSRSVRSQSQLEDWY